ncbi:12709_t:CDS:2, partial [Ambispora leptoticha]
KLSRQYQHYYTLIRWKNNKTSTEIHAELVIGEGDQAVSLRTVDHWIAAFKAGDEDVEDKPCSGCPHEVTTPETIAKVKELVSDDLHITIRGLADLLDISLERVSYILNEELNMKKICAKWVLYKLKGNKQWIESEENRSQIARTAKN